ncbi:MAG TPA: hypothetical protein VHB21_18595 [Minicystis sp.]|nr:hypothetical protein [Minicystis sp.]
MSRIFGALFLAITFSTLVAGCVVHEAHGCRYGWVEGHRDAWGRWIPGHCR